VIRSVQTQGLSAEIKTGRVARLGSHLEHVPQNQAPKPSSSAANLTLTSSVGGKESYSTKPSEPSSNLVSRATTPKPEPVVVEEDDLTVTVAPGTQCKRQGCSTWSLSVTPKTVREMDQGLSAHTIPDPFVIRLSYDVLSLITITQPIFHEGSKVIQHFTGNFACSFIGVI
jgi:hypothetical protein